MKEERPPKREAGYYWVKFDNTWQVAEYWINPKGIWACWCIVNDEGSWFDESFQEIDEQRLIR